MNVDYLIDVKVIDSD